MKKDNIYYNALRLAIPIMLQSAVTNAVGLVDNIMIGSLGTESISAVSIAGQVLFVFNMAVWGEMAGLGIYLADGAVFSGAGLPEYAIFDTSRRRKDRGYIFV